MYIFKTFFGLKKLHADKQPKSRSLDYIAETFLMFET